MAYQAVSFTSGETLTSSKMNQMAANDASFHDGTGIDNGALTKAKLNSSSFDGETDANGWKIQYLPSGKRIWTKEGTTESVTVNANNFNMVVLTGAPVGIQTETPGASQMALSNAIIAGNWGMPSQPHIITSLLLVHTNFCLNLINLTSTNRSDVVDWGIAIIER